MSARNSGIRLTTTTKELLLRWRETRTFWVDDKSDEFEMRYMDELQQNVDTAAIVIEKLEKILSKIKKDCE